MTPHSASNSLHDSVLHHIREKLCYAADRREFFPGDHSRNSAAPGYRARWSGAIGQFHLWVFDPDVDGRFSVSAEIEKEQAAHKEEVLKLYTVPNDSSVDIVLPERKGPSGPVTKESTKAVLDAFREDKSRVSLAQVKAFTSDLRKVLGWTKNCDLPGIHVQSDAIGAFSDHSGTYVPCGNSPIAEGKAGGVPRLVGDLWQAFMAGVVDGEPEDKVSAHVWHTGFGTVIQVSIEKVSACLTLFDVPLDPRMSAVSDVIRDEKASFIANRRALKSRVLSTSPVTVSVTGSGVAVRNGLQNHPIKAHGITGRARVRLRYDFLSPALNRLEATEVRVVLPREDWPVLLSDTASTQFFLILPEQGRGASGPGAGADER